MADTYFELVIPSKRAGHCLQSTEGKCVTFMIRAYGTYIGVAEKCKLINDFHHFIFSLVVKVSSL